jgi:hypothetical protein
MQGTQGREKGPEGPARTRPRPVAQLRPAGLRSRVDGTGYGEEARPHF